MKTMFWGSAITALAIYWLALRRRWRGPGDGARGVTRS